MTLTLVCPHCSAELELDDIAPGTRFECPGCGGECIVPDADPPAPASRPRQLRIPARRDTAPPPVVVQAPQRGIFATAFRGCGVLLVMAVILAIVVTGCNLLGLFGAAHVAKQTAEALAATMPGAPAAKTLAAAPAAAGTVGDDAPLWSAEVSTDAMTDERSMLAMLREDDPPRGIFSKPAFLAVRFGGGLGISFAMAGVSALPDRVESQMRWDDAPAEDIPWRGSAAGFICLRNGQELYNRLRTSRKLRIRIDDIGGRRDAVFTLGGLDSALNKADPDRSIRTKADRLSKEQAGWMTQRKDDGTVVLTKFGRDHWASVTEGVSPIGLMILLDTEGRIDHVCISTRESVLAGGNWFTKIGANAGKLEPWREVAGMAVYGGDRVDLVRRLERAHTLRVDVHAGLEHAEVEWRLDGLTDALAAARRGVADL